MFQEELQANEELLEDVNSYEDWTSTVVTWGLTGAIAGLVIIGLFINFFLV
jgi:hypothetical protein